jgi:hypothetical protein
MTDEGNAEKLEYTSISELLWSWPLFDNVFLSMQGQNLMLVDFYLRDLEDDLLREYMERERTPVQSAMFVSAMSQMWIFAIYELLRTWKQMVKELRSGGTLSPSKSRDHSSLPNISEDMREHHRSKYANDVVFHEEVEAASKVIDPLYRRIDALRINLAKHEIKGIRGSVAPAPGFGRIDMTNGSIYWMVDLGDSAVDIVSRRTIADELRSIVLEVAK